nr:DUF1963 domain-containing protein [uncultured Cohaesibacter sp.]
MNKATFKLLRLSLWGLAGLAMGSIATDYFDVSPYRMVAFLSITLFLGKFGFNPAGQPLAYGKAALFVLTIAIGWQYLVRHGVSHNLLIMTSLGILVLAIARYLWLHHQARKELDEVISDGQADAMERLLKASKQEIPRSFQKRLSAAARREREPMPFDQVVKQFAQPAVIAYRPYPAEKSQGRSKLGGCPSLPPLVPWSRSIARKGQYGRITGDIPLHFLAQIDLADLPWRPTHCPDKGTLLFFASIDEELLWDTGDERLPHGAVRVIYDATNQGIETTPPEDLPPIEGGWFRFDQDFRLDDEAHSALYPEWALRFARIETLSAPFANDGLFVRPEDYQQQWIRFREQQLEKVFGPLPEWERSRGIFPIFASVEDNHTKPIHLLPFEMTSFPYSPLTISLICRHLQKRLTKHEHDPQVDQDLSQWIEWADRQDIGKLDPHWATNFVEFLNELSDQDSHLSHWIKQAVTSSLTQMVVFSGSDEKLAKAIPDRIYQAAAIHHRIFSSERSNEHHFNGLHPGENLIHHQLFGHFASSQHFSLDQTQSTLLLQLFSDYGVNMMFCDVGEIDFFIDKQALAEGRFDATDATTMGG